MALTVQANPKWFILGSFLVASFVTFQVTNWWWERKCSVKDSEITKLEAKNLQTDNELTAEILVLQKLKDASEGKAEELNKKWKDAVESKSTVEAQLAYLQQNPEIKTQVFEKKVYIKPDDCRILPRTIQTRNDYNESRDHFNSFISD